jgi:acylphosphatase
LAIIARQITISGKVQGVFFRGWTVASAKELALTGWVRNRLNGDVEAFVQGEEEAVLNFLERAKAGPPAARVASVSALEARVAGYQRFEQQPTI